MVAFDIIQPGEKVSCVWIFNTNHMIMLDESGHFTNELPPPVAPKGIYDVYLSNGEVLKNAIIII